MTGATRFGQSIPDASIPEQENLTANDLLKFDWLLASSDTEYDRGLWSNVGTINGYDRIRVRDPISWWQDLKFAFKEDTLERADRDANIYRKSNPRL